MCGLFGFIGKKKCEIDYRTLLTLGIDNDSRGGDSCGIFIDDEVEYGIDKEKMFSLFYEKSKLMEKKDKAKIIIGHCRKTSVGKTTLENAQPVVIRDDKTGRIDFVAIHNGTIINYKELAKKYLGSYDDKMTDSQVIAHIVFHHGFKVLGEYIGAGAFVFVDYRTPNRNPSVFVFKGSSMESKWNKKVSEERPLYFIETENGTWFSSISDFLYPLTYKTKSCVYTFPVNVVVNIDNNTLYEIEKIDRKHMYQKDYGAITSYGVNTYTGRTYTGGYDADDYYDMYVHNGPNSSWGFEHTSKQDTSQSKNTTPVITAPPKENKVILHTDGFYYFNGLRCNGGYNLANDGTLDLDPSNNKLFFFYNGVLVYGKNVFCILTQMQEEWMQCGKNEFVTDFYEVIYSYSPMGYNMIDSADNTKMTFTFVNGCPEPITGSLVLPFTNNASIMSYCDGIMNGSRLSTPEKIMHKFLKRYRHVCQKYDSMHMRALFDEMNLL